MRKLQLGLVVALSAGVALYSLFVYGFLPLGDMVHPLMRAAFLDNRIGTYTHAFAASVALLVGPAQFLRAVQRRKPLHRVLGRIYVAAIALGGLSGLWLATTATGGLMMQSGLGVLAVVWLYVTHRGLRAALGRRLVEHRAWMLRSFALTFAAVTLRAQLGIGVALGFAFLDVYPWLGWTSWLPNLLLVEWLLRRRRRAAKPDAVGAVVPAA